MRIITLDEDKKIIGIKFVKNNYVLQDNEIETDLGELGQVQQADGSFITPKPTTEEPMPTLEDKINYIYYKQLGVI